MKLKNKSNKWNINKDFIIKEYTQNRKSIPQLSKEIGMPYETLYWYKKQFGIPSHSISSWFKGKRRSPATEFKKGLTPWNKGKKGVMKAWNKGIKLSEEYKKKVSESTKQALKDPLIRKKISERTKEAMNNPEVIEKIKKTQFKKGFTPWNKDIKTGLTPRKGIKHTKTTKNKISEKVKEMLMEPETRNRIQKTQFKKGITPWNKGKHNVYSDKTLQQIKTARLSQIFPKHDTNAELILFDILNDLSIKFKKHIPIKTICQADVFIEPNVILFADGDYWHSNPRFYQKPKTTTQLKNIERDKKADSKLIKEGYIVKRFWEYDLINNRKECKESIKKLVKGD